MKVFHLSLVRTTPTPSVPLATASDLSSFSFFQRGSIQEFMNFFAATVAERTQDGQRQGVDQDNYVAYVYRQPGGLSCVAVTDKEYPARVALSLVAKILDEFTKEFNADRISSSDKIPFPALDDYIRKYQDPKQADNIMKVQQELDETKVVLHKTIEGILERGEKLESLVDRSNQLSDQSKMFYKTAKKTNACCIVM
ncbi:palmitoyltransferase [Linderina macrospora]|uniref:Palmitoyltransferase n=1 Tax=Linderina macrospora TaxID=4868 RepID=A0ACC1JEN6_9FUNG|nr:palmitoyltransferase [Linderina macrospora]